MVALLGIRHCYPRHLLRPEIPLVRGSVAPKANSSHWLAYGPLLEVDRSSPGIDTEGNRTDSACREADHPLVGEDSVTLRVFFFSVMQVPDVSFDCQGIHFNRAISGKHTASHTTR